MALLWAAGIIWFACDLAASEPQTAGNDSANTASADDQNRVAGLLGG